MVRGLSAFAFCLSIAPAALAHDVAKVTATTLGVRSGPGTSYSRIGDVQLGERYVIIDADGAWRKIWFGPGAGTGWVSASHLKTGNFKHRVVTATRLNVRTGAGLEHSIVGQAVQGSAWAVVAESGSWSKIWFGSEARWVHSGYLSRSETDVEFTMLQWSDIHCGAWDWQNTFRRDYVDRMNALPGRTLPTSIGGRIGHVWQVLATGDITEAGTAAQWDDHDSWVGDDYMSLRKRLLYPSYEAIGNHDSWTPATYAGITALHGNTYYSWNRLGIHFVALDQYKAGSSMAAEPDLVPAEITWLRNDLAAINKGVTPVVLFMHSPPKRELGPHWTTMGSTAEDLKRLLTGHKVLLILHGHWHRTMVNVWNGWDLIGCGYAANSDYYGRTQTTTVNVIRVKNRTLSIVPFDILTNQFKAAILSKTW